jgi:hypothetical protein
MLQWTVMSSRYFFDYLQLKSFCPTFSNPLIVLFWNLLNICFYSKPNGKVLKQTLKTQRMIPAEYNLTLQRHPHQRQSCNSMPEYLPLLP